MKPTAEQIFKQGKWSNLKNRKEVKALSVEQKRALAMAFDKFAKDVREMADVQESTSFSVPIKIKLPRSRRVRWN